MITSSEIEPKSFPDPDLDASSDPTRGKIVLDYWLNEYK